MTIVFSAGQAFDPHAACLDELASKFAEYLQSQAGKQQMEASAGAVLSLPFGVGWMGLPDYGWQLYVRSSYIKLRDRILQLR